MLHALPYAKPLISEDGSTVDIFMES